MQCVEELRTILQVHFCLSLHVFMGGSNARWLSSWGSSYWYLPLTSCIQDVCLSILKLQLQPPACVERASGSWFHSRHLAPDPFRNLLVALTCWDKPNMISTSFTSIPKVGRGLSWALLKTTMTWRCWIGERTPSRLGIISGITVRQRPMT